ncbi:hypothetical protein AB0L75_00800 [Streptomyces sp. NPDC052101]|uniref:hypothetical protein n=1 Tax=Streptomyces sp. NPDC052101 TaxID=3155763 RepID=UPI00341243E5
MEVRIPTTFKKPLVVGGLVLVRADKRKPKKQHAPCDFRVVEAELDEVLRAPQDFYSHSNWGGEEEPSVKGKKSQGATKK